MIKASQARKPAQVEFMYLGEHSFSLDVHEDDGNTGCKSRVEPSIGASKSVVEIVETRIVVSWVSGFGENEEGEQRGRTSYG